MCQYFTVTGVQCPRRFRNYFFLKKKTKLVIKKSLFKHLSRFHLYFSIRTLREPLPRIMQRAIVHENSHHHWTCNCFALFRSYLYVIFYSLTNWWTQYEFVGTHCKSTLADNGIVIFLYQFCLIFVFVLNPVTVKRHKLNKVLAGQ